MYVPFEELSEESKIWIYQSNRKFTDQEFDAIDKATRDFVENWAAHGTGLSASYQLKYNRFIILAVDQDMQNATGCSIDDSVRFIQAIEKQYDVDLLDKMNVT
ncbi:MAG: ABC transporter ATPase, partial [Flavobacterium sp.]